MHGNAKLEQLKKKLFVLGGYLLVTAALLVYVSYSQYRITVNGTVEMPPAYNVQAALGLNQAISSQGALYFDSAFLNDIAPGSNAETFASNNDDDHKITLTVTNTDSTAEGSGDISPLDLTYRIYIKTGGRIPLKFITFDDDDNKYIATAYTDGSQDELIYTFKKDGTGDEPLFNLSGAAFSTHTNEIFVGWDNSKTEYEDARFRKEVDELLIVAELVAKSPKKLENSELEWYNTDQSKVYNSDGWISILPATNPEENPAEDPESDPNEND